MHAIIALGKDRAGGKAFLVGMKESPTPSESISDETRTVINIDIDDSTDNDDGEMIIIIMTHAHHGCDEHVLNAASFNSTFLCYYQWHIKYLVSVSGTQNCCMDAEYSDSRPLMHHC